MFLYLNATLFVRRRDLRPVHGGRQSQQRSSGGGVGGGGAGTVVNRS